jgi:UDP-N-acetylmuramate dehydrogenase
MKHANFIQADPGGRASDVIAVIDHVKKVVQQKCGYDLRSEVRLIESKQETA